MSQPLRLSLMVVIGGAFWGILWLPLRGLAGLGLTGAWAGFCTYLVMALVMVPVLWRWGRGGFGNWRMTVLGGLFTGAAFSSYAIALNHTEVVRVLLLFYVTPIWSTLIGLAVLGERLTLARLAALALALLGLVVILGNSVGLPLPRNLGDWLALLAGLFWSVGSVFLFRAGDGQLAQQMGVFVAGSLVISGLVLLFGTPDPVDLMRGEVWVLAAVTAALALPAIFLTLWPANFLSPARLGVLLMSELVVGVASAALLAGEPFGMRELAGTGLIVLAGLVEVLGKRVV